MRFFCSASYRMATCLLPVSESLILTRNSYYKKGEVVIQGYQHFLPGIKTPAQVVHNGLDLEHWQPVPGMSKQRYTFISVFTNEQFILKGGDLILDVAADLPDCTFYIAGCDKPDTDTELNNVIFLGRISPDELKKYYSQAQFHLQLSIFEGFGYSLCEAMLCHCIPIGSNVNMIPEIIGDSGFILEKRDADDLARMIRLAMQVEEPEQLGLRARRSIMEKFSAEKRLKRMIDIIHKPKYS
jgi:glycosyltransferase involved in cell wall biosynthesis